MIAFSTLTLLWVPSIILLVLLIERYVLPRRPKGTRNLPGPRGHPLIGNFIDFPKSFPWLKFKEWGDTYGPIYQLKIFGVTFVILNDATIANQLLSARGSIYSDRSNFQMITMMTGGMDLAISPANDYWKRGRRFAASLLGASMVPKWDPVQTREARRMVVDIVRDPTKYQLWLERASTCVSVRLAFGKNLSDAEEAEYHTQRITARMHEIERLGLPGAYLVHDIPALMYLPAWMAPFKQEAKRLHEAESSYFYGLFQEATENLHKGIAENPPSFARSWVEKEDHYDLEWKEAAYVIATLYGGGSGTTSFAMQSYCLAMCHFPEWQRRLHEEIEQVVGPKRAPDLNDFGNLPIVRAVSKEVLRWRPVVPIGIPHRVTQEDVYEEYHIPKGALVFANQWGIHREKNLYPNGDQFCPERWLDPSYPSTYEQPTTQCPTIRRFSAFGFGRRICPGYEVAERALFIQIASLAWACRIKKKTTVSGEEIGVPWYEYSNGATSHPLRFNFDVEPYETRRVEVLKRAWEETMSL